MGKPDKRFSYLKNWYSILIILSYIVAIVMILFMIYKLNRIGIISAILTQAFTEFHPTSFLDMFVGRNAGCICAIGFALLIAVALAGNLTYAIARIMNTVKPSKDTQKLGRTIYTHTRYFAIAYFIGFFVIAIINIIIQNKK